MTNSPHSRRPNAALWRLEWWYARRFLKGSQPRGFLSMISTIGVLSIAIGVAVLLVVLGVMNGFERELQDRLLAMTPQSTLSPTEDQTLDLNVLLPVVEKQPGVLRVAGTVESKALAVRGDAVSAVWVRGVDVGREQANPMWQSHVVRGQLKALSERRFQALLGEQLATQLGVTVGDKITLAVPAGSVTPVGLMPRVRQFTVVGILHSGLYELDQHLLVVNINDAMRLFQLTQPTGLNVEWQNPWEAMPRIHELAVALGGGYYVTDWSRSHENVFRSIQTTKGILRVLLALVLAVAAFNMVAMLMMLVREKQREVAILRTLGLSPGSLARVFVWQGLAITAIGVVLGLGLGVTLGHYLTALVGWVQSQFGLVLVDPRVYSIDELPVVLSLMDTIWIVGLALVLGLGATLLPALTAARLKPAESLKHD